MFAPAWPYFRDFLLWTGIVWHAPGRQKFHLGWLRSGRTPDEFMHYLQDVGFGNHTLAWVDEDEYFGIRILDKENDDFQYHIRLYKDGEIKGHYEYTAEADWYKHFQEIEMEERREEFLKFLGDWVVSDKS